MARVGTLLVTILLMTVVAPAPAAAGDAAAAGDLALPDGPAWAHATVDVTDAACLRFVLAGVVEHAGDGQAVLVDVPRVGHLGVYFRGADGVAVRASANLSAVGANVFERLIAREAASRFSMTFDACHPADGVAYAGTFDAWALHTSGISDAVTRLEARPGALTVTPASSGTAVSLWGLHSFGNGVALAASPGTLAHGVGVGASAAVGVEKRVTSTGPVFGSLVHFDVVEEYELHGPAGAHAWKTPTGGGGSVDPGAFHGRAGEWVAKVRLSVGSFSSPRAFFVVADTAA